MTRTTESIRHLIEYYEAARDSFAEKMKAEDDERSNLKFKIAAFVIHELSHTMPPWFKDHFLTSIARDDHDPSLLDEDVQRVENAFYDLVADYLLRMEKDVEYVQKLLAPFSEEEDKKAFWTPIVFDAFLIVGIYFIPLLESRTHHQPKNINPRYLQTSAGNTKGNTSARISRHKPLHGASPR